MSTGLTKLRRGRFEHPFLPMTMADVRARGWSELDIIIISGDAYVDHPAFGPPLIARFLEGRGFKVGHHRAARLAQRPTPSARSGEPRLFFGIAAGNMDSMLNRLTAQKKNRGEDQYSPGGAARHAARSRDHRLRQPRARGLSRRADRARRHRGVAAAHRALRLLVGHGAALDPARRQGRPARSSAWASGRSGRSRGACGAGETHRAAARRARHRRSRCRRSRPRRSRPIRRSTSATGASWCCRRSRTCAADKKKYALASRTLHYETNPYNARPLLQRDRCDLGGVYFNPPALPLETADMDELYDLPFNRAPHPMYGDAPVPAFETVKNSLVIMRGCFGGCTFCSHHRARRARHPEPLGRQRPARAARACAARATGTACVSDLGGPTANMYQMRCEDEKYESKCRRLSCVHPGHLRAPQDRSRAAHRPHEARARGAGRQARAHRLGRAHRPRRRRRARPGVPRGADAPSRRRAALGGARARLRRDAAAHEEAGDRELRPLHRGVPLRVGGGGQGAVPHPLLHQRPPGLDAGRHDRAGAVPEEEGLSAAPGAGLHPHADVAGGDDVPHRASIR